jgi:xanthine/CO dehydrogenase XdhC/CoxF family maturation factor
VNIPRYVGYRDAEWGCQAVADIRVGGMVDGVCMTPTGQPWSDEQPLHGRVLVVTDNPIARALIQLAAVLERPASLLSDATALDDLGSARLSTSDAVVLCDHDTPDRDAILALLLDGETGYVAMMGSKSRAATTYAGLARRYGEGTLRRLHVPAGLNIGGKAPGEIALSVMAEIVANSYDRPGGPMRTSSR